jgi:hypothetical protein
MERRTSASPAIPGFMTDHHEAGRVPLPIAVLLVPLPGKALHIRGILYGALARPQRFQWPTIAALLSMLPPGISDRELVRARRVLVEAGCLARLAAAARSLHAFGRRYRWAERRSLRRSREGQR